MNRALLALPVALVLACEKPQDGNEPEFVPDFTVRAGVEVATVLDAEPGAELTLYDQDNKALLALITDDLGQAHFAYVPDEFTVIDSRDGGKFPIVEGGVLRPGTYEIRDDERWETSGPVVVKALSDIPPLDLYEDQVLEGVAMSPIEGPLDDVESGYHYITMRDGTRLGAMVRFPDPLFYGEGPYPTVIEYSGYSPSRPDHAEPGTEIANALGFATVSVNMRGTGCSGGVFDVFNRAQHADGYDVVEAVARQDWVLNHRVGMVGLSYPGISQLYVASTAPPSLAAVVPQSVIADAWEMQWPGGIYNGGFTRQWLGERDAAAGDGGLSWVEARIAAGDEECATNQRLNSQNIDFESFLHGLAFRPRDADDRDLSELVRLVEVPVFLSGGWQDEQTGALFGAMLDRFDLSPDARFVVYNGRHPDGYGPEVVARWFEFLEFYVAGRVPKMNGVIRIFAGAEFGGQFGYADFSFPPERFADAVDYDEALALYQADPRVLVRFESGSDPSQPGAPAAGFEATFESWPPPEAGTRSWSMAEAGLLAEAVPSEDGADSWTFDPEAATDTFFGPSGYQLLSPLWDLDWRRFPDGDVASYVTEPFAEDLILAGPAQARLWVKSPEDKVQVQVTLTEVRSDGNEVLVQSGWLDLGHRAFTEGDQLRVDRPYDLDSYSPVPVGQWVEALVAIPAFAHPFRAGSSLRVAVSTPGRNHGTWEFEPPPYDGTPRFDLGRGRRPRLVADPPGPP